MALFIIQEKWKRSKDSLTDKDNKNKIPFTNKKKHLDVPQHR